MKEKKFERELKTLINYVRSYGIEHMSHPVDIRTYMNNKEAQKEFTENVHKGFYLAQRNCIFLLKKILQEKKRYKSDLKVARKDREKERSVQLDKSIKYITYQELVLRKVMDSIAWQIFGLDLTTLRRLYQGQELIDITDSNIDSELKYIDRKVKEDSEIFVLINDMTSFIQIGDVVTYSPKEGRAIIELKEGETNLRILDLIQESVENPCPYLLSQRLAGKNEKFREQFKRDVKQISKAVETMKFFREGECKDLYTGANVMYIDEEIRLETYKDVLIKTLEECNKKNHAKAVVEDCLLIGIYESDKFPSEAFDIWAETLSIRMPIYEMRYSIFEPLGFPIFLLPFPDKDIIDIIMGRKIVKMTIDIDKWLESFKQDNYAYRWMTEKETARYNSKFQGKKQLFMINGKGVELIDKEGNTQQIGNGIFSRMFTCLNTPSSLRRYLVESNEKFKRYKDK